MDFLDNIRSALAEYKMIEKGDTVVAALSGGADSVSLLHALTELSGELGITVSACHVNHHLRGAESDADMHFCEEFCRRLGVELRVLEADVASMQQKHESLEECARRVRYDFFAEVSDGKKLATAHNSNDCAETVLLNLMRGTGLKGLCGVPPVRGNIIRPLIFCTREEVEEYCQSRGLSWVTDKTNLSTDYTRNKIRHIILPEMLKINGSLFSTMNRMEQYFEYCELIPNEKFFCTYLDMPLRKTEWHAGYYRRQIEQKILQPLEKVYGVDFSEANLRRAVEQFNEVCRIMTEINAMREAETPVITGYEFHVITLATYVAPKYLLIDKLEETLKELKTRRPDKKNPYRARVVVVGSEVDDIDFIKLVEDTGAYVCADRFCYGSFPGRDPITLTDDEDALTQICRQYMNRAQCPRYMDMPKMLGRREYVNQLAKEYAADGIIYEQIKFCDPWAYERMLGSHILNDDYGYPVLSVDRPYNIASSGQMRTRVQAFVESMEIKKIQGGKQ